MDSSAAIQMLIHLFLLNVGIHTKFPDEVLEVKLLMTLH